MYLIASSGTKQTYDIIVVEAHKKDEKNSLELSGNISYFLIYSNNDLG